MSCYPSHWISTALVERDNWNPPSPGAESSIMLHIFNDNQNRLATWICTKASFAFQTKRAVHFRPATRFIKKFLSIDCREKVFQNRSWIIAFRAGVDTRENCDDSFDEISRKFLQRLDAKFREISCLALVISRNVTSPNASPPPIFTIWRIVVGNNGVIEISDAWIFGNRSRFRSNFKRTNIFTTLACEMLLAGLKFACSVAESGIFL